MKIAVKLFGQVKDFFPTPHLEVEIEKDSLTVTELKAWLADKALQPERSRALIEDSALATESRVLQNQESIHCGGILFVLPPVCGG